MKSKVLAVVPARAGSKRLPKKNTKLLDGLPLIAHTLEAIKHSTLVTTTVVTSDCPEVLSISEQYSNTYSLERPAELSSDTASSIDVLIHAVEHSKQLGEFDVVCLLQPTSPLRTSLDIDNAITLYIEKRAKGVVSMTECEHSPLWSTPLTGEGDFNKFISKLSNARSQDLPNYYRLNGAIYLIEKNTLLKENKLFLEQDYYPYIMDTENSVDIDNYLDFLVAETIIKLKK
ncbi:cytidylyltransferase domain-containing protein [Pseudoalteromonas arctica]|uniref:Acylneuraminate cytidylyltransferase family protein n=1 Tax=Pseudoalteromonas arctica TaxID=394751 RepID=A0A7Y0DUX2_9GAMM|nr:acylneuraminate cytidylyltransferase family protein [Pseudoalteromonas arctica]NMM42027.1 acylneuraminate cytidylyltransferase family protein [Pseudoalteromonas arctica]